MKTRNYTVQWFNKRGQRREREFPHTHQGFNRAINLHAKFPNGCAVILEILVIAGETRYTSASEWLRATDTQIKQQFSD
jgi:hypothetical protein